MKQTFKDATNAALDWFLMQPVPKQVFFAAVAVIVIAATVQAILGAF